MAGNILTLARGVVASGVLTNPRKVAPGTALLSSTSSLGIGATVPLNIAPVVKATNNSLNSTDSVSHIVSLPAGIVAGETLIILFEFGQTGIAPATFAAYTATIPNWNSISDTRGTGSVTNDAHGLIVFEMIADGTEGATVTVTTSNSVRSVHHSYRVASCTGKVEVSTTFATDAVDPYQFDPPNLAPSWGASDYLIIAALGSCTENPTGFSIPPGYSTPINNQSTWSELTSCFRRVQNVSSEDPGVFSLTGGASTTGGIAATIIFEALECAATFGLSSDLSADLITPSTAWQGTAVFAQTATLSVFAVQNWQSTAILSASSSVIANTVQNWKSVAVLPATSSLVINALGFHFATAVLSGTSALVCDTKVYSPAIATLPCNSTLSATASIALRGAATLSLSSNLSVSTSLALRGAATLPLSGSIAAATLWYPIALATLPLGGSFFAATNWYPAALAKLPLNSSLSASMFGSQQATALIAATAAFYSDSTQRGQIQASAVLTPTSILSAFVSQQWLSQSALVPSANLSCFGAQRWSSSASLTATASMLVGTLQRWDVRSQWVGDCAVQSDALVNWLALAKLLASSSILVDASSLSASAVSPVLNLSSSLRADATRVPLIRHWQRHITATGSAGLKKPLKGAITRPNLTGEVS